MTEPESRPETDAVAGPVIRIASAVITDDRARVLLVRKRGTSVFMQAGGKIDPGETPLQAIVREVSEELGLVISAGDVTWAGRFSAAAANEAGHSVDSDIFWVPVTASVAASIAVAAEIEELVWLERETWFDDEGARQLPIAPLTHDPILRMLRERSLEG